MKFKSLNTDLVPASALGYAISFLLLVGLIASGVLFITSVNKRIEMNYELEEHMIFNNYFGLKYGALHSKGDSLAIVHSSGDTSSIITKSWGAYLAVVSTTFHNNRSIERSALVGFKSDHLYPALYLPDHKQVIKLCGETILEGDVFTSDRGLERGYIAGKRFNGRNLLEGKLKKSERNLPLLSIVVEDLELAYFAKNALKIELFRKDSSFLFSDQTRLLSSSTPIFLDTHVEGNIVFHSFDSIFVSSDANLTNVILIAPIIRFEKGFKGNVQAIANNQITCEEGVILNYPSSLVLKEKANGRKDLRNGIFLGNDVIVLGGILLTSEKPDFRKPVYLGIHNAFVGGLIYNQGETELQGKIVGSLYTDKFALKAGGGEYSNYLLDATISSVQLPDEYIMPNWLKEESTGEPILLTCF